MLRERSTPVTKAPTPRAQRRTRATQRDAVHVEHAPSPVVETPRWKRAMDVAGASVALVVLWPVFAAAAVLIRLGSPGPVFFRQERAGLLGRSFLIWKFRTMKTTVDSREHQEYVGAMIGSDEPARKLDDRDHAIPLGWLLRCTCIDELPQLINVLRGEMSLVGPRPDVIDYDDYDVRQRRRFEVLPGMTGLWQVSGKNRTTFAEMIELDIRYVEHRSLWLDTRILLMTVPTILYECLRERGSPEAE